MDNIEKRLSFLSVLDRIFDKKCTILPIHNNINPGKCADFDVDKVNFIRICRPITKKASYTFAPSLVTTTTLYCDMV